MLGVVLGVASLQPIREMTTESSGASEVYVIDNRGRIVAHSDPAQPLAADFSQVPIVAEFLQGRQKTGGTVSFELPGEGGRKAMVGTFIPLSDDSGWGVVVQTDEDTAYRTAIALRNQSFQTVAIVRRARRRARHALRRRDQPARSRSSPRARGAWPAATTARA